MLILETVKEFESFLEKKKSWKNITVQELDLTNYNSKLVELNFYGCLFLGCTLSDETVLKIIDTGGMIFPAINGLPYKTFLKELYTYKTLFDNFDIKNPDTYKNTTDQIIYNHFLETGKANPSNITESIARRLHDHSITEALNIFLEQHEKSRIVGIMGGHALLRSDKSYKEIAYLSRNLARKGFMMVSGGGPGAMEATHLGVWFTGYTDNDLNTAINILSEAPLYSDKYWLSKTFEVISKFPPKSFNKKIIESIGIPTWFYGHEPPTPFASKIAKYFANSVREAGLLAIALGGVIFSPGNAGTFQEIFQDACQNRYKTFDIANPMIFMNKNYWEKEKPIYPLLKELAEGLPYNDLISISDNIEEIENKIISFSKKQENS